MTIMVAGLDERVGENMLNEMFSQFCYPDDVKIYNSNNNSTRYAILKFNRDEKTLEDICMIFNNIQLYQQEIKVKIQDKRMEYVYDVYVKPAIPKLSQIAQLIGECKVKGSIISFTCYENAQKFIKKINQQVIDEQYIIAYFRR